MEFLKTAGVRIVSDLDDDAAGAWRAFARYREGTGHPAQVKLGDCFAYAGAMRPKAALLFKAAEFDNTDLSSVVPR